MRAIHTEEVCHVRADDWNRPGVIDHSAGQ